MVFPTDSLLIVSFPCAESVDGDSGSGGGCECDVTECSVPSTGTYITSLHWPDFISRSSKLSQAT